MCEWGVVAGWLDGYVCGWMDVCVDGWMDVYICGWMDEWRMNIWIDACMHVCILKMRKIKVVSEFEKKKVQSCCIFYL